MQIVMGFPGNCGIKQRRGKCEKSNTFLTGVSVSIENSHPEPRASVDKQETANLIETTATNDMRGIRIDNVDNTKIKNSPWEMPG